MGSLNFGAEASEMRSTMIWSSWTLKNVFAHAAVKEGGLVERGSHLLHQFAEKGLADEVGEGLLRAPACRGRSGGRRGGSGLGARG